MKKHIKVASIFMLAGILAACGSNATDMTVPKKSSRQKRNQRMLESLQRH